MLELSINEYFVVCVLCWKHGPSEKTIEKAVKTARLSGWVYVPDLAMNRCPECAAQHRVHPTAAGGSTSDNNSESGGG